MKKIVIICLTFAFYVCGGVISAQAHHGWGGYAQELEIDVTIIKVDLGNPHDTLIVEDAEGKTWQVLLAPPARNRRFGFGPGTVKEGQTVRLVGERHPRKREAKIHQIWHQGEMVYEYMYGRGRTSLDRKARRN